MAINSWLEKVKFHELHPLSGKLFVFNDTYQWERYIVCNDIMVPACGFNLCGVKTWEHFGIVCPLGTSLIQLRPLFLKLIGCTGLRFQQQQVL